MSRVSKSIGTENILMVSSIWREDRMGIDYKWVWGFFLGRGGENILELGGGDDCIAV